MRPLFIYRLLPVVFLTLGLACAAHAATSGPIVDTAAVAAAIKRGAVIWDVRSTADYQAGHIPGAVSIGNAGQVLRDAKTEDFIPVAQIEKILGGAGIDPAQEVIVYAGRGNPFAYFGLYTLQYFGGRNARVYHDGIDGWRAAGMPVSRDPVQRPSVALRLTPNSAVSADTAEVLAALRKPGVQIIDARTSGEFNGSDIRAVRGGHIPGALNIPYEMNWVDPETGSRLARRQVADNAGMSLKPMDDLRKLYSGLDPAQETIVYCQSGVRAAETAAVLAQLGFRNVKVYDSSWLVYANTPGAPAGNERFPSR